MTLSSAVPTGTAAPTDIRPRDDELDLFGLTHRGMVRAQNEDQFLLCTVHPQVVVRATSLPDSNDLAQQGQRLATIMLVADGVGGSAAGSRASHIATEAVTRYVATSLRCYHTVGIASEGEFEETLRAAAIEAHHSVRNEAATVPAETGMATTLSLAIVVWPWMYVVQVGDSRCYLYGGGKLRQLTRDQTFAQELVDQGVFTRDDAKTSPLNNVLSSAIGASEALPEITRVEIRERGCVILLCTDGLTKHVTDAEIEQHLSTMESAEQAARDLLQLALDRGGTDNVTLVLGRARKGDAT
ncbi:MAG: protein phosphatase 2C domain-containing protein [Gemmatimonadaceae bacterium]